MRVGEPAPELPPAAEVVVVGGGVVGSSIAFHLTEAMSVRAPRLLDADIATGWAGLDEVTPDHNALIGALIGEAPGTGRFLYTTGFSGHGFLQGPAAGEVVRDLYLGRRPFVDVSGLSAERFVHDTPRRELNCV